MSLRDVLLWPDPRLCVACAPVDNIDDTLRGLAADLLETMYDAPGRGLAAPQVGDLRRIFVMDPTWKESAPAPMVCINPQITLLGTEVVESAEGCLSIPGISARVSRLARVRMRWTDLDGCPKNAELTGFAALCAQHEMNHLDGIVTLDRVDDAQRATLISEYRGVRA